MHGLSRSTVQVMLEFPHSRKLETEADKVCVCVFVEYIQDTLVSV